MNYSQIMSYTRFLLLFFFLNGKSVYRGKDRIKHALSKDIFSILGSVFLDGADNDTQMNYSFTSFIEVFCHSNCPYSL